MVSLRLLVASISAIFSPASFSVVESFFALPDENNENDARKPTPTVAVVDFAVPDDFASMGLLI